MNAKEIQDVLRDVFGRGFQTEVSGNWVKIRCPLSKWTHESGADSNPSAGISVNQSGTSVFSCFTCKRPAPFHVMLRRYAEYTGENLDSLIEELEEEAYLGARRLPSWDDGRVEVAHDLPTLDKAIFLDLYEPAAGHPYLEKRGISASTAELLQLMVDPRDLVDGEERILFPVFTPEGDLHGFSGRAVDPNARLKVRDYHGLEKRNCLLGSHLITSSRPDKVLVVEGLFDYANAWECGQPAVAVMHSSITPAQANMLRSFSLPTYDFLDDDIAGRAGGKELVRALRGYQPVLATTYPEVWVPDPENKDGGYWLKDPGDLLPEEFEGMIREARLA